MKKSKTLNENILNEKNYTFKTGDIILFSGNGIISNGIKLTTHSRWSHVGMIIRITGFEMVAIWESTTIKTVKDLSSGEFLKGVQITSLRERITEYKGDIALRRLNGVEFTEQDLKNLTDLRRNLTGKPYEEDQLELIKAAYDGPGGLNKEDLSSVFCSELVAEAYQTLGLLSASIPSNEYTPADFSEKAKNPIKLLKGSLGPEEIIKDI